MARVGRISPETRHSSAKSPLAGALPADVYVFALADAAAAGGLGGVKGTRCT